MELKISNLKKPSNKEFKRIADFLLFTLPLYSGAVITLPINDTIKLWITFAFTLVIISLKGLTKFTAEEDTANNEKAKKHYGDLAQSNQNN